jgi:transglutaminase-like putative cysteine protease
VQVGLVKPGDNPAVINYDWLARFTVENTRQGDLRYLTPSWGIESDDAGIISKARVLSAGKDTDYLRARAIYEWVKGNMTYDMAKFRAGELYDNEGAAKALRAKKGLCRDYANLVTAMCRALGIEARTVIGQAGNGEGKYGHAWSEVKVDGRWASVDAVWGLFDPAPEAFAKTHQRMQEAY